MKNKPGKLALVFVCAWFQMEIGFSQDDILGISFNPPLKTLQDQGWDLVISVVSPTRFWTPEYWEIAVGNSGKFECDSRNIQVYRVTRKWIDVDTVQLMHCQALKLGLTGCIKYLTPHEDTIYSVDSIQIESTARISKLLSLITEITKENYRGPSIDGIDVKVKMAKREVGEKIVTTKEGAIDPPHSYHPVSVLVKEIAKVYKSGNRCR